MEISPPCPFYSPPPPPPRTQCGPAVFSLFVLSRNQTEGKEGTRRLRGIFNYEALCGGVFFFFRTLFFGLFSRTAKTRHPASSCRYLLFVRRPRARAYLIIISSLLVDGLPRHFRIPTTRVFLLRAIAAGHSPRRRIKWKLINALYIIVGIYTIISSSRSFYVTPFTTYLTSTFVAGPWVLGLFTRK